MNISPIIQETATRILHEHCTAVPVILAYTSVRYFSQLKTSLKICWGKKGIMSVPFCKALVYNTFYSPQVLQYWCSLNLYNHIVDLVVVKNSFCRTYLCVSERASVYECACVIDSLPFFSCLVTKLCQ